MGNTSYKVGEWITASYTPPRSRSMPLSVWERVWTGRGYGTPSLPAARVTRNGASFLWQVWDGPYGAPSSAGMEPTLEGAMQQSDVILTARGSLPKSAPTTPAKAPPAKTTKGPLDLDDVGSWF